MAGRRDDRSGGRGGLVEVRKTRHGRNRDKLRMRRQTDINGQENRLRVTEGNKWKRRVRKDMSDGRR